MRSSSKLESGAHNDLLGQQAQTASNHRPVEHVVTDITCLRQSRCVVAHQHGEVDSNSSRVDNAETGGHRRHGDDPFRSGPQVTNTNFLGAACLCPSRYMHPWRPPSSADADGRTPV